MSRNQFVRNTLTAIQMQLPGPTPASTSDLTYDDYGSIRGSTNTDGTETIKSTGRSKRSGSITSWKSMSRDAIMTSPAAASSSNLNGSTVSIQATHGPETKPNNSSSSSVVYGRNWEHEMESLLKVSGLVSIEFSS
jgi:PH/SEC7 domain-containing protein